MTYVIGTAGHVDHGKSTLVEALTGIDPDRLAEEKEREMTIDLGFAWLTLPNGETVGVVDVPGHRDFIENMLAGVGGIDLALLVIAADEGVMPQTREHLAILDLLDVEDAVVAVTKSDLVADPEWLDLVMLDISELLSTTALHAAPLVPVSARTGEGLEDLLAVLADSLSRRPARPDRGKPRLPIDRVFTISGFGTVVTGTLAGGWLAVGDAVEIVPRQRQARIRGLQSHMEAIPQAQPGSRVAVNLAGVDKTDVQRGDVLATPGILQGTILVDVYFRHLADAGRPLKHNSEVKFFSGAAETLAHVRLVGDRELAPGAEGWLQLRLTDEIALDKDDRFILRYPSPPQTIGGGTVLDAHPPHRWRRFKPSVIERFETLAAGSPEDLLLQALEAATALTTAQAAEATGLTLDETAAAAGALVEQGDAMALPEGLLVARASWGRLTERILREVADYHRQYPLRPGMPREALRSRVRVDARLFNPLLDEAVAQGIVADEGKTVRLPDHAVRFTAAQEAAIAALYRTIEQNPTAPPSVKETVAQLGEEVYQALLEQGRLVQVSPEVCFDAEGYDRLVGQVRDFIEQNGSITVAEARDLFNTSRKYVLGLLEHLDQIGVTRRVEDRRVLGR